MTMYSVKCFACGFKGIQEVDGYEEKCPNCGDDKSMRSWVFPFELTIEEKVMKEIAELKEMVQLLRQEIYHMKGPGF